MQFKVPQDVQREDTIIGPITLKQLIILGMGGGVAYALYVSLAKTYFMEIWLPPVAITLAITTAFAFLKIYNMTFERFLMSFFEYSMLSRKRIWIQGAGRPQYIPELMHKKKAQKRLDTDNKNKKSLAELTSILDSHNDKELTTK